MQFAVSGCALFERRQHGLVPTRAALPLSHAARLALPELEQARAEFGGREDGRVTVGVLPLARSVLPPHAGSGGRSRRCGWSTGSAATC
ncbi:hypothetical protein [Salipiger thiooxidans]|uniref:hypothetical protein n=1 Tax=Salipiger thiooxidans TaxID=282683 RepID=UPI001CD1CCFD|nr:hypothetical protein [Salipiger thiooxidans]MCA0847101.1 hypothetical protein [Salipiger thiooxidans]